MAASYGHQNVRPFFFFVIVGVPNLDHVFIFIAINLYFPGERSKDPQDVLQKVQEAPTPQSYPVQEGKGFPLCSG